jgi:hypothetical protein
MVFCSFAGVFPSFAQESVSSDSLLRGRDKVAMPSLRDSLRFHQTSPDISIPQLKIQGIESQLKQQSIPNNFKLNRNDTTIIPDLFPSPKFKPYAFFNLGASKWYMPVIGGVTTFSPTLNYQVTKDLNFYGGVSFSQFHNLSNAQSILAPGWPVRSNIIANGFIGAEYRLFDRIMLHGSYQRSLYNQLPGDMMMFAPGQEEVVAGASIDLYHGLGVTVDHIWEFDLYGHRREGFRVSPYIDLPKFIKFLKEQ